MLRVLRVLRVPQLLRVLKRTSVVRALPVSLGATAITSNGHRAKEAVSQKEQMPRECCAPFEHPETYVSLFIVELDWSYKKR